MSNTGLILFPVKLVGQDPLIWVITELTTWIKILGYQDLIFLSNVYLTIVKAFWDADFFDRGEIKSNLPFSEVLI